MFTRSQRRKNNQQESAENVREIFVYAIVEEKESLGKQDVLVAGPSNSKSPRVETSILKRTRMELPPDIKG